MSAWIEVGREWHDDVEVFQRKWKVARQHTDDLVLLIVQSNSPTNDIGRATELVDPERVTQNHDASGVRSVVGRPEEPPRGRRYSENVECVGGDSHALES